MDINAMIQQIKEHPQYGEVGMILCHNGVVRQSSREGRPVTGLKVSVDHGILERIITTQKKTEGILEILVKIEEEKRLNVGDDVMAIVVAGDIRETVIETLTRTLNRIKSEATSKEQYYKGN